MNNYIIFHHIGTTEVPYSIELPVSPTSLTESASANFVSTSILGRNAPVYTYTYSGPRQVSINMVIHREMTGNSAFTTYGNSSRVDYYYKRQFDSLDILMDSLRAVVVSSKTYEGTTPPKITLCLDNQIKITGVVSSVNTQYSLPIINGKYQVATIAFTVNELDPYDAIDVIMSGGYMNG